MSAAAASPTGLKEFLQKLSKNYQTLRKREAKYASAAPLDRLNQLPDLQRVACQRSPRNLTPRGWQQFMGEEIGYRATCEHLPLAE